MFLLGGKITELSFSYKIVELSTATKIGQLETSKGMIQAKNHLHRICFFASSRFLSLPLSHIRQLLSSSSLNLFSIFSSQTQTLSPPLTPIQFQFSISTHKQTKS